MSRQKAINNFCRSCIWDKHSAGTWRQQVEACPSPDCPLYEYRPKTTKKGPGTGEMPEGIRRYREKQITAKLS